MNTLLRKQQLQRALTYLSIGANTTLQLNQHHDGNSLRSLIAFAENKTKTVSNCYNTKNSSIFYGFETTRIQNGLFFQNVLRFIGKKFFSKTKQGERLGAVHSNISTLNYAQLGISAGVRSPLYSDNHVDKKIATLFAIQMHDIKNKKWISLKEYTHVVAIATNSINVLDKKVQADTLVPIQSLYEKNGFSFNLEGRLRKFNKAVASTVTSRSLESFLGVLSRFTAGAEATWDSIWNFDNEISFETQHEKIAETFQFNAFYFAEVETSSKLFPFAPSVTNYYLNDIISSNSPTMGASSLFQKI